MDKGKIAVGVILLTLVSAAVGYVVATAYLTFRDYGLSAEIDFFWLAQNYLDMRIVRPNDFEKVNPAVFQDSTELAIGGFRALDRWLDQ